MGCLVMRVLRRMDGDDVACLVILMDVGTYVRVFECHSIDPSVMILSSCSFRHNPFVILLSLQLFTPLQCSQRQKLYHVAEHFMRPDLLSKGYNVRYSLQQYDR